MKIDFVPISKASKSIKVELVYIGEGFFGDYDPIKDAEDEPLVRFDIYIDPEHRGNFNEITESRCTCISAKTDEITLIKIIDAIFNKIAKEPVITNLSALADQLSYLCECSFKRGDWVWMGIQ